MELISKIFEKYVFETANNNRLLLECTLSIAFFLLIKSEQK